MSASCGGQSAEPQKTNSDGASGSTGSAPYGSGGTSAGTAMLGAGGSQRTDTSGSSGAPTAGDAGAARGGSANGSNTGGTAGFATAGSSGASTGAGGSGGSGVAGAAAGSAGSSSYGGLTGAGGHDAGRGSAGDDSAGTDDAAGAPATAMKAAIGFELDAATSDPKARSCNTGKRDIWYRLGDTYMGQLVADGSGDVTISCKIVINSDGSFDASGSVSGTGTSNDVGIGEPDDTDHTTHQRLTFSFRSHGSEGQSSDVTMSLSSVDTGELGVEDAAHGCTLQTPEIENGGTLSLIDCPFLVSDDDSAACHVEGTVIFRNCEGSEQ